MSSIRVYDEPCGWDSTVVWIPDTGIVEIGKRGYVAVEDLDAYMESRGWYRVTDLSPEELIEQ